MSNETPVETSPASTPSARAGANCRRFRFNQKSVDALPAHDAASPSREAEYTDEEISGLKLLVGKSGRKTYFLRYTFDGRKRIFRIGEHGPFSVAEARKEAQQLKASIARGTDPQKEREERRAAITFEEFATQVYLPHSKLRNRSWMDNEGKIRGFFVPRWGKRRLDEITTLDVQRMMDDLRAKKAPATANRFFALLHRMLRLAVLWGHLEKNPANGVSKFRENNRRERYLSGEELERYLKAMEGDANPVAMALLKFLLLTGLRLGEASSATWANVELEKAQLLLPDTKAGGSRWVLLNPNAVALLRSQPRIEGVEAVFPNSFGGNLYNLQVHHRRVCERAGIENLRIHDLRHSFASAAINSGATLYEVQHLLGHRTSITTTRYAHLSDDTLRQVSKKVGEQVAKAEPPPPGESVGNVVVHDFRLAAE